MPGSNTTGIPKPDEPGRWLVPPWPANASFDQIVRHFLNRTPSSLDNTRHQLAYWDGYRIALASAPTDRLRRDGHAWWITDMRKAVDTCAQVYREKLATETATGAG
jgi:hypothetical protein